MLIRHALFSDPLTVEPKTSLLAFIDEVLDRNQTTAIVVEDGVVRGIISVLDIFHKILPPYVDMDAKLAEVIHEGYFEEKFAQFASVTADEIMNTQVDCVGPDDTVIAAVALFVRGGYKTIPVVEDGKFIGIVTRRSVLSMVRRGGK